MKNKILNFIDLLLFIIIFYFIFNSLIEIFFYFINNLQQSYDYNILINNMSENPDSITTGTHNTEVKIIHDDGNWSNAIRTLFIYGTGALRLKANLSTGGSPLGRGLIISSTFLADSIMKILSNTINDPNFIKEHYKNWELIWKNKNIGEAKVVIDPNTENILNNILKNSPDTPTGTNNLLSSAINSNNDFQFLDYFMNYFKDYLTPVSVTYNNILLSEQIYHISILLYIAAILITFLIIFLLFNIFIFINSDKFISYFKNKYIKMYINLQIKVIKIEIFLIGGTIILFMINLIEGIRFIATHPIIII
jgi:hypothetical protein